MALLTETQTIILSAGAQRSENTALPLPKGLAGEAAKIAINRMIALGWLLEVGKDAIQRHPFSRLRLARLNAKQQAPPPGP